jgi:hypothetical protein
MDHPNSHNPAAIKAATATAAFIMAADIMGAAVMAAVTKAAATSYLDNYYSQGGRYTMHLLWKQLLPSGSIYQGSSSNHGNYLGSSYSGIILSKQRISW